MSKLGNLLNKIKSNQLRKQSSIEFPYSSYMDKVLALLKTESIISDYSVVEKNFKIDLAYRASGFPTIIEFKLVSKPSVKKYQKSTELKRYMNGRGLRIISTNKGLMKVEDAIKDKIGGEVLCEIF